jgi:site-specific recombinase XerD
MKNDKILKVYENKLSFKNYSSRTINIYVHYVSTFLSEIDIDDSYQITTKQIVGFLENKKYTSISQQNQYIGSIKLFARYILNKKDIHLSKIERPKKEKKLPQVIDKSFLLKRISKIKNIKHKTIISLAYSTGMRVSEVINLRMEHIDSARMIINIINGKGKKDRIVPLSTNILTLLKNYYMEYRPNIFLFNGQNSIQYSTTSCNKIVKKYIGSQYHFHLLRHSSFTAMLESGTDLRIIQSIAGHNSSKTTEIYTHVSKKLLCNVVTPL